MMDKAGEIPVVAVAVAAASGEGLEESASGRFISSDATEDAMECRRLGRDAGVVLVGGTLTFLEDEEDDEVKDVPRCRKRSTASSPKP